jgi:hypothetical protein
MTEEMLILFPIPCTAGFRQIHRKPPTQPRDEIVYHAHYQSREHPEDAPTIKKSTVSTTNVNMEFRAHGWMAWAKG